MSNKANLNVAIDNGSGVVLNIVADSSGYLVIQMSDGKGASMALKLEASDSQILSSAVTYANAIRRQIPQS